MNTTFLLMAQYNGRVIVPIDMVCRDYFPQFTPTKLVAKIRSGELKLPLVRLGPGQKATKGVPLIDLAGYLDQQIESARKEVRALMS